jgi:hypothetical protein
MTPLRFATVLAASAALALASVTGAGAARTALTPAAYRAQASALCTQAKQRIANLPKSSSSAKPAVIAKALDDALNAVDPLLPAFRKLQPPASLKALHEKTAAGLHDGLTIGHAIATMIGKGTDLQTALAKVQAPFLSAMGAIQTGFKGLGLATCESVLGAALGGS